MGKQFINALNKVKLTFNKKTKPEENCQGSTRETTSLILKEMQRRLNCGK